MLNLDAFVSVARDSPTSLPRHVVYAAVVEPGHRGIDADNLRACSTSTKNVMLRLGV